MALAIMLAGTAWVAFLTRQIVVLSAFAWTRVAGPVIEPRWSRWGDPGGWLAALSGRVSESTRWAR